MSEMSTEMASLAVTKGTCYGCRFWESDARCADKKNAPRGACEQHKIDAGNIVITHLTKQLKEAEAAAVDNANNYINLENRCMVDVSESVLNDIMCEDEHFRASETLEKFGGD